MTETVKPVSYLKEIICALIVALIVTLVSVLGAAFAIKTFNISTEYIGIINQVIKGASIFIAALCCLKKPGARFVRGILTGIAYILLAFVVFSLFNGSFNFGVSLFNDAVLGAVSGLLSGIAASIIRK